MRCAETNTGRHSGPHLFGCMVQELEQLHGGKAVERRLAASSGLHVVALRPSMPLQWGRGVPIVPRTLSKKPLTFRMPTAGR